MNTWDEIFSEVVVPKLAGLRFVSLPSARPRDAMTREVPQRLAGMPLAGDHGVITEFLDTLTDDGSCLAAFSREVVEPTARWLGDLWLEDRTTEWDITRSLVHLQLQVHRLSAAKHSLSEIRPRRTTLVAPQPGEPHSVFATLSSELYRQAGWQVCTEFPSNQEELTEILHRSWFDVLELSLSGAFRRDHRLGALAASVSAARAASLNRSLVVLVGGRVFFEDRQAWAKVGADAGCATAGAFVGTAQQLFDTRQGSNPSDRALPIPRPRPTAWHASPDARRQC